MFSQTMEANCRLGRERSGERHRAYSTGMALVAAGLLVSFGVSEGSTAAEATEEVAGIRVDAGHPWRPPFDLDLVGRPLTAVVEVRSDGQPQREYQLVGYLEGEVVGRHAVRFSTSAPYVGRVTFDTWPEQLVLLARAAGQEPVEVVRQGVERAPVEADAAARPEAVVNPVDLGTILVPADWLMLAPGQRGSVEVAAISRSRDLPDARVTAWFESSPLQKVSAALGLLRDRRRQSSVPLPEASASLDRDVLHVSISAGDGTELWHKAIRTMLFPSPPKWPEFGATETKLRYDAPISILARDGTLSSMDYDDGWDPELNDVVVSLPGGARFVFWRGSSYVPFWAGRYNTGLSYEWAETGPPPDGFVDSVEPLMDKELRYGRVEIVESTAARVRVRWSYQSCDFNYKVWGDSAVEDFCFYRDGFGTRSLTLTSAPDGDYELSEFIILTPKATYPFSVLPPNLVDVLFLDGQKREFRFPFLEGAEAEIRKSRGVPAVYRVRLNNQEASAAVYFNPNDKHLPPAIFAPFFDQGYLVTPAYWGSHWPLARGKTTGGSIDDRVQLTPAHNSIMSWARSRPEPLRAETVDTTDTLGRSRRMLVQQWVWLIGMTDADDQRLLQWARSFAQPPSLKLRGGRLESYLPERRAHRIVVEASPVTIEIEKGTGPICRNGPEGASHKWDLSPFRSIHPVFELVGAPKALAGVKLGDRSLGPTEYAWDGQTLWLAAEIAEPTVLEIRFEG